MNAHSPAVVRDLAARGVLTAKVLEDVIRDRALPLVEPQTCTFVHRGQADAVHFCHFGVGLPPDLAFRRIDGSDLWYLVLDLPRGCRLEYKLAVTGEDGSTSLAEDPLNPRRASNPFGANSVCEAFGYRVPAWAQPQNAAPKGELRPLSIASAALGRDADVTLYLPARFSLAERYPLLVVHDGGDYLHYAGLAGVLDNLIHAGRIPPVVAAFSFPQERLVEYAADKSHAVFLAEELVPTLEADFASTGAASGRCLMGASFGAVAALAGATCYPGYFGRLLLQSGSFASAQSRCATRDGDLWRPVEAFVDSFVAAPARVSDRVFMSCGRYESLICENRAFHTTLAGTGMEVRFVEALDGHNWGSWRDQLGTALPWLLAT
jgi:enterochelin esterase-like enzyme